MNIHEIILDDKRIIALANIYKIFIKSNNSQISIPLEDEVVSAYKYFIRKYADYVDENFSLEDFKNTLIDYYDEESTNFVISKKHSECAYLCMELLLRTKLSDLERTHQTAKTLVSKHLN